MVFKSAAYCNPVNYSRIITLNKKDDLPNLLNKAIKYEGINLREDIMCIDLDNTIFENGSDYNERGAIAISYEFIEWLINNTGKDQHIIGLTSATVYYVYPTKVDWFPYYFLQNFPLLYNHDKSALQSKATDNTKPAPEIRSEAIKKFEINFWNPFNKPEVSLGIIYDEPCPYHEINEIEGSKQYEFIDRSLLFLRAYIVSNPNSHPHIIAGGFADNKFREIFANPMMYNGIIFSNFQRPEYKSNISKDPNETIMLADGHRKGDIIKLFLDQISSPKTIMAVDDDLNMLAHMAHVVHNLGINFIGVWYNWANFDINKIPDIDKLLSLSNTQLCSSELYDILSEENAEGFLPEGTVTFEQENYDPMGLKNDAKSFDANFSAPLIYND
jgi:hypothetical protein